MVFFPIPGHVCEKIIPASMMLSVDTHVEVIFVSVQPAGKVTIVIKVSDTFNIYIL